MRNRAMWDFTKMWLLAFLFTASDIVAWHHFKDFAITNGIASQQVQGLYNSLWYAELDSLMIVGLFWTRGVATPILLWIYNYISVESFFYYILQGRLPPYSMPWLNVENSTNLYIATAFFIGLSILLVIAEQRTKKFLLRRLKFKKQPTTP